MHGRTPLVCTVGRFNHHTYRAIIDNYILPFVYNVRGGPASSVLQDDNCGPHRANSIADYLANEEISRMEWPPQSLDCNCIENVWGLFKQRLRKRNVHPRNSMHLFTILFTMWNELPQSYLQILIASMPKCVRAVRLQNSRST